MANPLPQIWRFDPGDYQGLGETFNKFLGNLNLYTTAIYNLLNGGLGFANLQRIVYTTTVTAGTTTPFSFANPLPIAPSGVSVVRVQQTGVSTQAVLTVAVSAAQWTYNGSRIAILNLTGLTSGNTYSVSLEIM